MDEIRYIAVVKIHDQPPIETQACVQTFTKSFPAEECAHHIWEWALRCQGGGEFRTIASLEIRPDE